MAWNVSEGLLGESLIQKVQNCSVTVRREIFTPDLFNFASFGLGSSQQIEDWVKFTILLKKKKMLDYPTYTVSG